MSESYHFGHSHSPEFRNSTSPGESPKIEEAFASFEDSQFGTTNESAKPKVFIFFILEKKENINYLLYYYIIESQQLYNYYYVVFPSIIWGLRFKEVLG